MPWIEQLQSANWREGSAVFFGAYILGCFTTGFYLVRKRTAQDIRELGSGNVGAKNVGRVLGRTGFFLTVVGDALKGALAVWLARYITHDDGLTSLAMLGVVAGHVWPVQLRFQGGKGVVTSISALIIYDSHIALAFVAVFALAFALLRKFILAGLIAFLAVPVASLFLNHDSQEVVMTALLSGLVVLAHRKNLLDEAFHFLQRSNLRAKHHPPEI